MTRPDQPEEVEGRVPEDSRTEAAGATRRADALDELVRWVSAGGEWRALSMGPPATVSLVTCDGGEEMSRIASADPSFVAYIQARLRSEDPGDRQDPI